uniref:Uncharacterized protein ORF4 n=1 Tax=Papilio dardanus TaxID=77259 RepID=B9WPT8_PAPDA|nr:hypothetical protein [Papilio dardanus]
MEAFIIARGLHIINAQGQPATFAGERGESNVDLTLAYGGVNVEKWKVHDCASSSDHRLITYEIHTNRQQPDTEPARDPPRFRDWDVDWTMTLVKTRNITRLVRMVSTFVPSGRDVSPPSVEELGDIVKALPNTASGLDGISSRIVKNVWRAAPKEFHFVFAKCTKEGVFPRIWKDGRLIVVSKGNNKPPTDPKAYRPITLLPILGKILERVLLRCVPSISRGITMYQHGFFSGRSTVTALRSMLSTARITQSTYVQAIFLNISGAFDNAWWPMILVKAKGGGCPPNIFRIIADYFTCRRVGLFVGDQLVWKTSTMGCPQGSVLGPTLWNLLMNDLLLLPLPEGVTMVAYADDISILIEANSRARIESKDKATLTLVRDWGERNRLDFSPPKSTTMTIKGKFQRPPVIRFNGVSIRNVRSAKFLGVVMDASLSFTQHASEIGEKATKGFGKLSHISTSSWGIRYPSLKLLYKVIYVPILTYAAECWFERAKMFAVRSALLRSQRNSLVLITKAYRSTSTAALSVLAGVLPADLEVNRAGLVSRAHISFINIVISEFNVTLNLFFLINLTILYFPNTVSLWHMAHFHPRQNKSNNSLS